MKTCSKCKHFLYESASGWGWCEEKKVQMFCGETCTEHQTRYSSFAQRCMDLPLGFDQTLCDGKTCPVRRKCVRYMLHVKKRLTNTPGGAFYMVSNPKYNFELCFWNYYELKENEKQNV